jgi:plastocyanin
MKRITISAWALALGLLLAACGGGGGSTQSAGGTTSPSPTASETAESSPTPSATETSGEVRIAMEDNHFQPSSLSVASGSELELDNEGQSPHTFTIDGQDVDTQVAAGGQDTITLDLAPGTYAFFCRFHQSLGMKGSITVT